MNDGKSQNNQEIKPEWVNADNPPTPDTPNVQSIPHIHEVPIKKKNVLLKIIISLIFVSFGIIGTMLYQNYFIHKALPIVTPSPMPTSASDSSDGWGTYTNTSQNYYFKYPNKNYTACSNKEGGYSFDLFEGNLDCLSQTSQIPVISSKDYFQIETKQIPTSERIVEVDGVPANVKHYAFTPSNQYGQLTIEIASIPDGTSTTKIAVYTPQHSVDQNIDLFNQILSTFKFISKQTSGTKNWETYVSPDGKYSFRYPNNLIVSSVKNPSQLIVLDTQPVVVPDVLDSRLAPIEIMYDSDKNTYSKSVDQAKSMYQENTLQIENIGEGGKVGVILSGDLRSGEFREGRFVQAIINNGGNPPIIFWYEGYPENESNKLLTESIFKQVVLSVKVN